MTNYKNKYLKYKLKYEKLNGGMQTYDHKTGKISMFGEIGNPQVIPLIDRAKVNAERFQEARREAENLAELEKMGRLEEYKEGEAAFKEEAAREAAIMKRIKDIASEEIAAEKKAKEEQALASIQKSKDARKQSQRIRLDSFRQRNHSYNTSSNDSSAAAMAARNKFSARIKHPHPRK